MKNIPDGLSHTFILGEISWDMNGTRTWLVGSAWGTWEYSGRNMFTQMRTLKRNMAGNNDVSFGSRHRSGATFGLGDGSVQFLPETTDLQVLKALSSRNGKDTFVMP